MGLFTSRLGVCLYLLLPHRWAWALLTPLERARVDAANLHHNTHRPDFVDPRRYRAGADFDAPIADAVATRRDRELVAFLDRVRPAIVLEVGPGSGHHTRTIVEHPAVRRYVAVDINPSFLDFLRPRLEAVWKSDFSFDLIAGSVADIASQERFDAIVLLSTVHHIPDRLGLFRTLADHLRAGGRILAIDPTHYVLRWWQLVRKLTSRGYLVKAFRAAQDGRLGTHAMCQWHEYRAIARQAQLRVARVAFGDRPRRVERLRRWLPLGPLERWTAQEITFECQRAPAAEACGPTIWERLAPMALKCLFVLGVLRGKS